MTSISCTASYLLLFCEEDCILDYQSRKIKLQTVAHIQSQISALLSNALTKVIKMYARGGFTVNLILMDQEFAKLELSLDLVEINTAAS